MILDFIKIVPRKWKESNESDDQSHQSEESDVEVICPNLMEPVFLPKTIQLQNNLGVMKLRSYPCVLRMHKFKESSDPHQFFYSELLLYRHWRKEEELLQMSTILP